MNMNKLNVKDIVSEIPAAWVSRVLGEVGPARIKALRMDALPFGEERHKYNEALFVLDGKMELSVEGEPVTVGSGELVMIEADTVHSVLPESFGTLMIIDLSYG